jgi:hypothetical protein
MVKDEFRPCVKRNKTGATTGSEATCEVAKERQDQFIRVTSELGQIAALRFHAIASRRLPASEQHSAQGSLSVMTQDFHHELSRLIVRYARDSEAVRQLSRLPAFAIPQDMGGAFRSLLDRLDQAERHRGGPSVGEGSIGQLVHD